MTKYDAEWATAEKARRAWMAENSLYSKDTEHASCGVGLVVAIDGKRSRKVGDMMGIMVKPFIKLETDEDFEKLEEFAENMVEFFADNALEHERIGETIDRIGLPAFLEALEVDVDPNMVNHPRTSCYVRTDDFDEEAAKWFDRQAAIKAADTAAE